jgi:hypothetical protein
MVRALWRRTLTWIRPDPARLSASIHVEPQTNSIVVRPFLHVRDQRLPITPQLATRHSARHGDRWFRLAPAHRDILHALLQSLTPDPAGSSTSAATWRLNAPDLAQVQRLASVVDALKESDALHLTPQAERLVQSAHRPVETSFATSVDFNQRAGSLDVTITELTSGTAPRVVSGAGFESLGKPRLLNGQFIQVDPAQRESIRPLLQSSGADPLTSSTPTATWSTPIRDFSRVQALAAAVDASRDRPSLHVAPRAERLLKSAMSPIEAILAARVDFSITEGTLNVALTEGLPSGDEYQVQASAIDTLAAPHLANDQFITLSAPARELLDNLWRLSPKAKGDGLTFDDASVPAALKVLRSNPRTTETSTAREVRIHEDPLESRTYVDLESPESLLVTRNLVT